MSKVCFATSEHGSLMISKINMKSSMKDWLLDLLGSEQAFKCLHKNLRGIYGSAFKELYVYQKPDQGIAERTLENITLIQRFALAVQLPGDTPVYSGRLNNKPIESWGTIVDLFLETVVDTHEEGIS